MDTVIRKSNGTGLKPNQELRRCSFQSGGGLVTVNFIGASEKTPKSPASRKNSNSPIKKYNRYAQTDLNIISIFLSNNFLFYESKKIYNLFFTVQIIKQMRWFKLRRGQC